MKAAPGAAAAAVMPGVRSTPGRPGGGDAPGCSPPVNINRPARSSLCACQRCDRMALRAFLVALKVPQHELLMLGAGFDDVAAFVTFDNEDVKAMEETLRTAGVPPGHIEKIIRTVRDCQDKELRHKPSASPLKFDYGKKMPLLETLRDEVRALKRSSCGRRAARRARRSSSCSRSTTSEGQTPTRSTPRCARRATRSPP